MSGEPSPAPCSLARHGRRAARHDVGAAWPARSQGSPAGSAHAAARQGPHAAQLAAAQGRGGGGARRSRRRCAGRRGGGVGPWSRGRGGPEARGGGARAHAGRPRGLRAVVAGRPRRRGGTLAVVAPELEGEEVGEDERLARKLTVHSIWAGDGQRGEIDEEGGALVERQWRPAMAGSIPAGKWLNRARGGAAWVRGEAREVEARGIEARCRGVVGTAAGDGSARALFGLSLRKKERARKRIGLRGRIRTACAEAEDRRRGDAWSRRRCAGRRHGLAYVNSAEQGNNSERFDQFFTRL